MLLRAAESSADYRWRTGGEELADWVRQGETKDTSVMPLPASREILQPPRTAGLRMTECMD